MIILNASTIKKWDIFTIKNNPITSLNLMQKAGNACANKIIESIKDKAAFHIVVNNGRSVQRIPWSIVTRANLEVEL